MRTLEYLWQAEGQSDGQAYALRLVHVAGTHGRPFVFGTGDESALIEVRDFYLTETTVTQALWNHVMGDDDNPAAKRGLTLPQENVSWEALLSPDSFLQRINASALRNQIAAAGSLGNARFRLPTETEWEYAARGGPHWRDGFTYSGGNGIAAVAWYDRRHGDHTQPVAQKAPNQLGLYDMSGNVWEWCQDVYTSDVQMIPADGSAFGGAGEERVWRGGCFHNWAMHCTVSKRYSLPSDAHDGCVGFRLALSVAQG